MTHTSQTSAAPDDAGSRRFTPRQALTAIRQGALVIDIRSAPTRQRDGTLDGAVIVAKIDLIDALSPKSRSRLSRRRNQPVILFCVSHAVSGPYVDLLQSVGIEDVHDIEGGFGALKAEIARETP